MLQNKATKALDFYENKLTYVSFFFSYSIVTDVAVGVKVGCALNK